MTESHRKREIHRVTALVESERVSTELLVAATDIAARLHAEVQGVLFEDANLRRFARLDVGRMVSRFAAAGPVAPADLLASVEALAEQGRAALRSAAQALGLSWSFQVVAREPDVEPRVELAPGDLLVVQLDHGRSSVQAQQVAALWSTTAADAASMLVIRGPVRSARPAVLIGAASDPAARALAVAAELLPAEARHLDVLIACAEADAPRVAAWARQRLQADGWRAHVTALPDAGVDTVLRATRHAAAGLLVLPRDAPCLAQAADLERLMELAHCALLLTR